MFGVDSGKILQLCEVIPVLLSSTFVIQVASEGSRTTLVPHDLPQIIAKICLIESKHLQSFRVPFRKVHEQSAALSE